MKAHQFVERFFWIFLFAGLVLGLVYPVYTDFLMLWLEPLLMIMLFMVFLKSDLMHILGEIKNYKLMLYLVCVYMIIIPLLFFFTINQFNQKLAVGILLLTAMPAAVAAPALTDILKGNTALAASITIITSMIAPFSIPILFGMLNIEKLSIDPWVIFKDLTIIVFVPMVISQIARKYFQRTVQRKKHLFTPINILILSLMVYIVVGSQRDVILGDSVHVISQLAILYLIFILLHIIGYMLGYKQRIKNKISITIGAAYMNNGLAIVLAAKYFDPYILVLMVLSDLPWNTLLAPFRKAVKLMKVNEVIEK
jgi:BASS family bile acid:Na+ symporter